MGGTSWGEECKTRKPAQLQPLCGDAGTRLTTGLSGRAQGSVVGAIWFLVLPTLFLSLNIRSLQEPDTPSCGAGVAGRHVEVAQQPRKAREGMPRPLRVWPTRGSSGTCLLSPGHFSTTLWNVLPQAASLLIPNWRSFLLGPGAWGRRQGSGHSEKHEGPGGVGQGLHARTTFHRGLQAVTTMRTQSSLRL